MGIISSIGGYLGSKDEAKGHGKAQKEMTAYIGKADEIQGRIDPFAQHRQTYATQLNDILQGNRGIQTDPGYGFVYDEAMRATGRQAAAGGYNNSGNVQTALQNRAAGLASQQYGSIIDRLTNLAGAGSQTGVAGGNAYANVLGNAHMGRAESHIGQGAANSRGISSLYSGIESGVMDYASGGGFGGGSIGPSPTAATNVSANTGGDPMSMFG